MKPHRSSITAEHNALLRTHESLRPEAQRELHDPFAACFLPDRMLSVQNRDDQIQCALRDWEKRFPGVSNAIIARTCFIDACLAQALSDGVRQVVILGAGYDTRALRFETLRKEVMVFELDHPATQERKKRLIRRFVKPVPAHIRFIPVDFHSEAFDAKLLDKGYDRSLATLFIWEGVTYYLSARAVDSTLAFVAGQTGPGSSVVFDYIPLAEISGAAHLPEAGTLRHSLKQIGEEIVFGLAPDQLDAFLAARGLTVLKNMSAEGYAASHFKKRNRHRVVSSMFFLAQAGVARAGTSVQPDGLRGGFYETHGM